MHLSNRASRSGFEPATFVDLLIWKAHHYPDRRVFTFLQDGEAGEVYITYRELDRKARAIAALLQSFVSPGEYALLIYPTSLDYIVAFFGCLYAGVVAVPAYPPDPARLDQTLPRLQAILSNIQASVILTTTPILDLAELLFDRLPNLETLQWMATDTVSNGVEFCWQEPKLTCDSLALLQFSSGSTRYPKGIMASHGDLLHTSALIAKAFHVKPGERGVFWLPPYHDMGLIGGILQPIYSGLFCVFLSPLSFLQQPFRWLQAVSRYKASISGGPYLAYDLCVRKITHEQRASLDLSSWRLAFTGSEPVQPQTLEHFTEAFEPSGFRKEAFHSCGQWKWDFCGMGSCEVYSSLTGL